MFWLPKCGENVEANEGLSLTTMSMERCIPNDNMWRWRVTFGTAAHSTWATLENVMAITGGGAKTVHGAAYIDDLATACIEYGTNLRAASRSMLVTMVLVATDGCATTAMIGKDLKTVLDDVPPVDVHYIDTPFGVSLGTTMAALEGE